MVMPKQNRRRVSFRRTADRPHDEDRRPRRARTPQEDPMTLYAALIFGAELDPGDGEFTEMSDDYAEFGKAAAAVIRGGEALYPTSTATTVRVVGGKGGDVV